MYLRQFLICCFIEKIETLLPYQPTKNARNPGSEYLGQETQACRVNPRPGAQGVWSACNDLPSTGWPMGCLGSQKALGKS